MGAILERAEGGGELGGEVSGVVGALVRGKDRRLGGGVGRDSDDEAKKLSFNERTDDGAGADTRRGVVSVSSASLSLSREEDADADEARDGERVSGGGG